MIEYRLSTSLGDCSAACEFARHVDVYYPGFVEWYWNKVVPGVLLGQNELLIAEDKETIVGLSLFKRDPVDPKFRCLRVDPRYEGRGIGIHLIDRTLRALDHDRPSITVPEEKINDLSRILVNRYDFDLMQVDKGLYRQGKLEYVFNQKIDHRLKTPY